MAWRAGDGHWGVPDAVTAEGTAIERDAFRDALRLLQTRIKLLVALPIEQLDGPALQRHMDEIGRAAVDAAVAAEAGALNRG